MSLALKHTDIELAHLLFYYLPSTTLATASAKKQAQKGTPATSASTLVAPPPTKASPFTPTPLGPSGSGKRTLSEEMDHGKERKREREQEKEKEKEEMQKLREQGGQAQGRTSKFFGASPGDPFLTPGPGSKRKRDGASHPESGPDPGPDGDFDPGRRKSKSRRSIASESGGGWMTKEKENEPIVIEDYVEQEEGYMSPPPCSPVDVLDDVDVDVDEDLDWDADVDVSSPCGTPPPPSRSPAAGGDSRLSDISSPPTGDTPRTTRMPLPWTSSGRHIGADETIAGGESSERTMGTPRILVLDTPEKAKPAPVPAGGTSTSGGWGPDLASVFKDGGDEDSDIGAWDDCDGSVIGMQSDSGTPPTSFEEDSPQSDDIMEADLDLEFQRFIGEDPEDAERRFQVERAKKIGMQWKDKFLHRSDSASSSSTLGRSFSATTVKVRCSSLFPPLPTPSSL